MLIFPNISARMAAVTIPANTPIGIRREAQKIVTKKPAKKIPISGEVSAPIERVSPLISIKPAPRSPRKITKKPIPTEIAAFIGGATMVMNSSRRRQIERSKKISPEANSTPSPSCQTAASPTLPPSAAAQIGNKDNTA